jgi:hypothetical protein
VWNSGGYYARVMCRKRRKLPHWPLLHTACAAACCLWSRKARFAGIAWLHPHQQPWTCPPG